MTRNADPYCGALAALKRICGGPSENVVIAKTIRENVAASELRILDVGTGDGTACTKIAEQISEHKISSAIVGIDIRPQHRRPKTYSLVSYRFSRSDFMQFEAKYPFDVILFRQSIYYLGNLNDVFRSARAKITTAGIIVVVCWNEGCILRRILSRIDALNPAIAIERETVLAAAISERLYLCAEETFLGEVDLSRARADARSMILPLQVLLRGRPLSPSGYEAFQRFLRDKCSNIEMRQNSIIVLRIKHEAIA